MGLYKELCVVFMVTILFSILLLYESRELDGYKFPVYSTEFCPRNQTEWDERSSAINCTENNGYMCLPNQQRTELIEFCYKERFAWVEEGVCLYLIKGSSRVEAYNCVQFISGCPTSNHRSSESYKYQSCFAIENGCFIAEPSCNSTKTATTSPVETTDYKTTESGINSTQLDNSKIYDNKAVNISFGYITTEYAEESTVNKDSTNNNNNSWVTPVAITLGFFVPVCVICILVIFYYKQGLAANKRRSQEERNEYDEHSPFIDRNNDSMEKGIVINSAQGPATNKRSQEEKNEYDEHLPFIDRNNDAIEKDIVTYSAQGLAANKRRSQEERNEYGEHSPFIDRNNDAMEKGIVIDSAQGPATNIRSQEEKNEYGEHLPFIDRNNDAIEKDIVTYSAQESQPDLDFFNWWQEEHGMFIPTKACEEVESLINTQNLVIVVGHSGSGKSAIIQHIALKYRSQGWAVKPVTRVDKIIKAYESNNILPNKTLYVINDPIGKDSFDEMAFAPWKENDLHLRALLKNSRMLLSCRKCVQCDIRAKGFFKDSSKIIDIDSGKCILSDKEKRQILNKYNTNNYVFSETDLEEVLKTKTYFPLLCKLFFSDTKKQKDGVKFFMEPVEKIKEEIRAFKYECKEKYCALILIVLFNNALCVGDVRNDENSEKLYEHALKLCGMETCTAPFTIRDALETLKDGFVSKKGNAYQFCHDLVMEITSFMFGSDYHSDMIKYADIVFLRKRVKLEDDHKDQTDQLTIYISDTDLDSLAERLLKEVVGANIFDVVLNPLLKDKKVADALIKNIEKDKAKIKTLFVKLFVEEKLRLEKQNVEKSKEFFFSKLDFLNLNSYVSPVCALIVFSHVDLSIYCLKALQQLHSNFKDCSVFLTVCCNGAIDLLNMFSEDDIKTYLRERWGYFYPIHIVSVFHNLEILQKFIQLGVDLNQSDECGDTALMNTIELSEYNNTNARHSQTLTLLLSNGADINLCNKYGRGPLYIACENGHDSTVQLLLSNGADINSNNKYVRPPLYAACENGHDSTVQLLLSNGADINLCNKYGRSPLYKACENGHDSTVQLLLSNGADVNLCSEHWDNSLIAACRNGHDSTVQLLLSKGADVNLCNKFGESPLYAACFHGHDSTVQLLLSNGADINLCDELWGSPLIAACKNGHNSTVQLLLSNEADINLCCKYGGSPLIAACENGHDSTVQLLLSNGADINLCYKYGGSPLIAACENGHDSTVQLLLSNEADINLCCKYGGSPLIAACEKGHDSTVQLLLSHGADINLCNEYGNSPLYTACENGRHSTVQLLLNSKADINLNKKNPALIAFYMRQHAIIKTFLDAGVITSIVNYCQLKYVSSDWCDKDDITGQYLLRKDNIVDNMYDLDSFFSLFVFCQVEELTREYNDPL
nr:uncharacterized protein LOC105325316 isoform X2 [Crassostrea gigas]XP_034332340.1 uncharacterized protein LOC105325316 isoform X3 [Crassostrea gigas]